MSRTLTRRRLEWLVRARGTDLTAWPEGDRSAALALMRRSPAAREAFAAALVLEDAPELGCGERGCGEPDWPVLERMQAGLRRSLAPLPLLWRGLRAGALLACVAAGLYIGMREADADSSDPFAAIQTVSLASLDP